MNRFFSILTLFLTVGATFGQTDRPMISAVSVLTIHVSDTNVHQSVFEFLAGILKLPVEYGPESAGPRRYAAVYAGNMFIEPCGPYSNMQYPVKDFRALFFGLNCRSDQTSAGLAKALAGLKISYEQSEPDLFRIRNEIVDGGVYLAVSTEPSAKSDENKAALFQKTFKERTVDPLGLEYVQEIWLGYTNRADLLFWSQILGAPDKLDDPSWTLNCSQRIRLIRSGVKGISGIVFKVRSLEMAERYLKKAGCYGRLVSGKIELETQRTNGLLIYLSTE